MKFLIENTNPFDPKIAQEDLELDTNYWTKEKIIKTLQDGIFMKIVRRIGFSIEDLMLMGHLTTDPLNPSYDNFFTRYLTADELKELKDIIKNELKKKAKEINEIGNRKFYLIDNGIEEKYFEEYAGTIKYIGNNKEIYNYYVEQLRIFSI